MSNGDDVLDNWEEIDEARLNNTLQKIEAARKTLEVNTSAVIGTTTTIETTTTIHNGDGKNEDETFSLVAQTTGISNEFQPMKLLQRTPNPMPDKGNDGNATALKSPLDDMAAAFQPVMMVLHKSNDDYQSANYTQPINSQTVKILRRPTQSSEPRNNGVKPKQPIKTLQQREQEYAEARLRILGSAKNPEDDLTTATANSTASTPTTASIPNTAAVNTSKGNSSPKTPGSVGGGGIVGVGIGMPSVYNNHNNYHHHHQQQQQQSNFYYQQQQPPPQSIAPAYNNRTSLLATMSLQQQQQQQQQQQHQHQQPQQHHMHHQSSPALLTGAVPLQQTWSPIVGGSVSSPILRQQQQQQQQQQQMTQLSHHHNQESVLRLPRGPDGSTGFQMRR